MIKKATFGDYFDLQGGMHLVLEVETEKDLGFNSKILFSP